MNEAQALAAFQALAQETRLRIVRVLIEAGPDGLSAGRISGTVGIKPSNTSVHLAQLETAGLVHARRKGRSIVYAAGFDAVAGLVNFLMDNCCGGRTELCEPLFVQTYSCTVPSRAIAAASAAGSVACCRSDAAQTTGAPQAAINTRNPSTQSCASAKVTKSERR